MAPWIVLTISSKLPLANIAPPVDTEVTTSRLPPAMSPRTEVARTALKTSVFEPGKLADSVELITVDHKNHPKPPVEILVATPKDAGTYPVCVFLHGFKLDPHAYKQILKHVASFGFIMVAPQFVWYKKDIYAAAQVTDWLTEGLLTVLPNGVKPNLSKLALTGHSKGGHTAFSLVLGHGETKLKFSAIIGLDPVAGHAEYSQISPKILTYEPSSLDIAMPALVIGTGLGGEGKEVLGIPIPPCAPKGVNHTEFYFEGKPPCYHFVTKDYGHLDMIDDDAPMHIKIMKSVVAVEGDGSMDMMRRTVAGIMVAFLKAKLNEDDGDLEAILKDPKLAPATLDPVECRLA